MKAPRRGSTAKAWTLVRMPERTQEGADHRHRERDHRQHHRPGAQAVARRQHRHRMEQRGRRQPRHQRRVLDRIPEPPAAPAQLVIGPIAAGGDPQRQEHPGTQYPRPHRAGEGRADVARQQRADREGECDGEPDIAGVKRRRVEGEAGVLQQRVEAVAVGRHGKQAGKGVRAEQQKGVEAERDRRLRAQGRDQRAGVEPPFQQCHRAAGDAEDGDPEQHRPFMIPPRARNLVQERLGGMAVFGDQLDAHVAGPEHADQQRHRGGGAQALDDGDRADGGGEFRAGQLGRLMLAGRVELTHAEDRTPHSCNVASAAASHSAASPASAIISGFQPPSRSASRASRPRPAAACTFRHAWRGCCSRRTASGCLARHRRRRRCPRGTSRAARRDS